MAVYDNVDQPIRWLPDALAQVATGVRRSRRQLHTTSNLYRSRISSMMAVTSRTPSYSLRREDVADRTLVFTLKRLDEMRTESEIQREARHRRNDLLSDYAKIVQRALLVPWDEVKVADPGMRMADFARVATRIGHGLGEEMRSLTDEVVSRIRLSQNRFATEEDVLTTLLRFWLTRHKPVVDGGMNLGSVANEGRPVTTSELLPELNAIAREFELRFQAGTPESLGSGSGIWKQLLGRFLRLKVTMKGRAQNGLSALRQTPRTMGNSRKFESSRENNFPKKPSHRHRSNFRGGHLARFSFAPPVPKGQSLVNVLILIRHQPSLLRQVPI